MPVNLTTYTGNAGLGAGANPNIPVVEKDTDLNVINKAAENAMLLNHENNVKLFQQKVADRNYLQDLINEGKVQSGDIDDKDRPAYDAAEKEAQDAYSKIRGVNDTQGLENYRQKVLALNNVTKSAQGRRLSIIQQEADIAKETLPSKQKAMQAHLDQQKDTPVYNTITPYQTALDLNVPDMDAKSFDGITGTGLSPSLPITKEITTNNAGKIKTTIIKGGRYGQAGTTSTTLPKGQSVIGQPSTTDNTQQSSVPQGTSGQSNVSATGKLSPISITPTNIFDYDKLLDNNARLYSDNEEHRLNQDMFVSSIESGKIGDTDEIIKYANQKINQYDQISGKQVTPFIEGKDYIKNPQTGQIKFNLPISEVVSKLQLAKVGNFKTGGQEVFNKDIGEYLNKQQGVKALAAQRYANANLAYKKADALQQFNPPQVFKEIGVKAIAIPTVRGNTITRVSTEDMSQELKDDLGIAPLTADNGKQQFYNIVPTKIFFKNKSLSEDDAYKAYNNWLTSPKYTPQVKSISDAKGGQTPTILDFLYANKANFDVDVQGLTKEIKNKNGDVIQEAGKPIRSNKLQTLINQVNKGGVKGKELLKLLTDENGGDNGTDDGSTTTSTSDFSSGTIPTPQPTQ